MSDLNGVNLNVIPDAAVDLAKEIYEDGIQESVQSLSKTASLIPRAINVGLSKFELWLSQKEYNIAQTKKLLTEKLSQTPVEKIVPPESYVAVPALQAISYCMDTDSLRNMYANLLARSMTIDEKENVHPSFVEIIKQLSPLDALILQKIKSEDCIPVIQVNKILSQSTGEYNVLYSNLTELNYASHEIQAASICNLIRLNLIQQPNGVKMAKEDSYERVFSSLHFRELILTKYERNDPSLDYALGVLDVTDFGNSFISVCINDVV